MPKSKEIVSTKSTEHIVVNLHPSEQYEVENSIFTIRGVQVMLDSDLARFYGITTGNLNKAVKRNIKRFPEDFMFQLTKEEVEDSRFHFGTLNNNANSSRFQF
ncbi:MAG: ORF6N domain-containing protein, partial [Paludibacteraceae bacterium]|nr:ORF6N domain-containing protein [Paludibacteraceae bacterium]